MSKKMEGKRVMTHAFGPATLIRLYKHRETKETVWEVRTSAGERMHLSQSYAAGRPRLTRSKSKSQQ